MNPVTVVATRVGNRPTTILLAAILAALSIAMAGAAPATANIGMAWGGNESGELGDGTIESANGTPLLSELPVAVSNLSGISAISGGGEHSLALTSGTVKAWGDNTFGELGDGTSTGPETCGTPAYGCSRVPVAVSGLSGVSAISAGGNGGSEEGAHSMALLSNGTVRTWGNNTYGQLGDGAKEKCGLALCSITPVPVKGLTGVTAISAGGEHSLALSGGAVWAWGANRSGQLGDGEKNGPSKCEEEPCAKKPVAVSGLSGVTAIAAGGEHSLALLSNGTVEAWGANESGQLGDGTSSGPETCGEAPATYACSRTPVAVSGLSHVLAIAAGDEHSLALIEGGTVVAWGANESGQLGDGTHTGPETCGEGAKAHACSTKPVEVSELTGVTRISAGGEAGLGAAGGNGAVGEEPHSMALLSSGTVKTWGSNEEGELGIGTLTNSDVPVTVIGLSEVEGISAGGLHDLAFGAPPPAPTVTGVSPKEGPGGASSVEITGTHLTLATAVKFGSASVNYEVNSDTSITATSAPGSGTVDVTVTTPGGTSATSEADRFKYVPPAVTAVSPGRGSPLGGTSVTITGTDLIGASAVKFGSHNATSFKVESETSIKAVSPAGSGTVDVTVTTPAGTSATSEADRFSYLPVVTGVSPSEGHAIGGAVVTVTGVNFIEVSAVKFGSANATTFKVESETSITAVSPANGVPPGSGTVDVTVTTLGGASATGAADRFTYTLP